MGPFKVFPYQEITLIEIPVRQHVNPLSRFYQLPLELPGIHELYEKPELPLHLDIGCARGTFLLDLSPLEESWNHLGVEIRQPLVHAANKDRVELKIKNVNFLFCNANISLHSWLVALPQGVLQRVSIQFPDPWFKKRHHKRRILDPSLLASIANTLGVGMQLYIQSDVFEVINSMRQLVDISECFDSSKGLSSPWLEESPMMLPTEREAYALEKGIPIYRLLYIRNENKFPYISAPCEMLPNEIRLINTNVNTL